MIRNEIGELAIDQGALVRDVDSRDQETRIRYLDESARTYERVRELRTKIYGESRPHPHILSCVRGLGMNQYQRVWLLTSLPEQKLTQLRTATHYLTRVMADDERLDYEDGTDPIKTLCSAEGVRDALGVVPGRRSRRRTPQGRGRALQYANRRVVIAGRRGRISSNLVGIRWSGRW